MVISAPSGAGKSTLCRALADRRPEVRILISCTTRAPRPGEVNDRDYHFLTPADFEKRLAAGEFIESARVHDHMYGTLKAPVDETLAKNLDAVLNIDTQGARSVKAHFPDCVRVFICPPSWTVLEERLAKRAQDHPEVIKKRLANARGEIEHLPEFDYVVINDKLETAVDDLLAILRAEKRRPTRIAGDLRKLDLLR